MHTRDRSYNPILKSKLKCIMKMIKIIKEKYKLKLENLINEVTREQEALKREVTELGT